MKIDHKLLDAYYKGECTDAERQRVEEWLQMQDYADHEVVPTPFQKKSIWKRVHARTIGQRKVNVYWMAAAACLLCCFTFFAIKHHRAAYVSELVTVTTQAGQRAKVVLPDSSMVYLKPLSTLVYEKTFRNGRSVQLLGEGFFDVQKRPDQPFVITGDQTETRVLGTSFLLENRGQAQSIIVQTGKVAYRTLRSGKVETLVANQRAELDENQQLSKSEVLAAVYTAWTRGELTFDNQTLAEIIPQLEAWYGATFVLQDAALAQQRFTGTFTDPTIAELLQSMGFALQFDYSIQNKTIRLQAKQ